MKFFLVLLFLAIVNGIKIKCQFEENRNWTRDDKIMIKARYFCKIMAMDFSDDPKYITEVTGDHIKGKSNDDVQGIEISVKECKKFNLQIIPRGFSKFFKNIIYFDVRTCAFNSLDGDELDQFPNLQWFNIPYMKIQRIPGNLFKNNPKLIHIGFHSNKIKFIGEGLFDNLKDLKRINLNENVCVNKRATTASEIKDLIEFVKKNCKDEIETTTMIPPLGGNEIEKILKEIVEEIKKEISDRFKDIENIISEGSCKRYN